MHEEQWCNDGVSTQQGDCPRDQRFTKRIMRYDCVPNFTPECTTETTEGGWRGIGGTTVTGVNFLGKCTPEGGSGLGLCLPDPDHPENQVSCLEVDLQSIACAVTGGVGCSRQGTADDTMP